MATSVSGTPNSSYPAVQPIRTVPEPTVVPTRGIVIAEPIVAPSRGIVVFDTNGMR